MKYIKNYNNMNEKISWNKFLLSLLIGYIGYSNINKIYKDYKQNKEIHYLYNIINSTTNYPTGEEKEIIENTRNEVIDQIKQSDLFNKFGKPYIIDSIKTATIKIADIDIDIISSDVAAAYIYLEPFTKQLQSHDNFKDIKTTKSNVILINKNFLDSNDLSDMLTHEIYHYVDKLYDSIYVSTKLDLSQFIDKKIQNKNYLKNKFSIINTGIPYDELKDDKLKDLIIQYFDTYDKGDIEYLTKPEEIYARWKTLKSKLIDSKIIQDYKNIITTKDIIKFSLDHKLGKEDLDLLLMIDLNKVEELDKLIN